jgi:hypothetical protein
MRTTQIAVFGKNQPGNFGKVCRALADQGINILALSITSDVDTGVMRLVTNDNENAKQALEAAGFSHSESEVIICEFEDEVGAGARVGETLAAAGVNIEQAYASSCAAVCSCGRFLLVLKVDNIEKAIAAIGKPAIVDFAPGPPGSG